MNLGHKRRKNTTVILPTLPKFCILLHWQASHKLNQTLINGRR